MAALFKSPTDPGRELSPDNTLLRNSPLLKWNRIYCVLTVCASLCTAIGLYFSPRYAVFHGAALILLAGAVLGCFHIAKQAKISIRKSEELLLEAKRRTTEIAALYDTSQYVSGQHHLSSLLQTIVGKAMSLLATPGCALFLYDVEHNDFEIALEVGVGMPVGTHLPLKGGLAGHVADTMKPLIVNDYPNWPARSEAIRQLPIRSTLLAPMIREGELVGVLGVHESGDTQRKFTEDEARLLSLFADNAAGAVFNARLMDELQDSKERFRIAAECAIDIVYDWDLTADSVEYFGAGYKKAVARSIALPATRKEYWDFIHPDDAARVREALEDHLKDKKPFSVEYRVQNKRDAYVVISDRATAIRNSQGDPVRLIGAVSNITARKQAEQMKSDFVSFVTHQLRTPLSGVKWMLELAMDSTDNPEDVRSFLQDARTSTDRLIGLVNDLLDLSRLERGKMQITYRDIRLTDLTREVIEEMHPLVAEKEQTLTFQAAEDFPVLKSDPQLLRQVVLNLMSNAIKYTPKGGEMKIRLHFDNACVHWEIQDNGIGIPEADLEMLFKKFYRAGNATEVETEGTGLGLYLVRLIAEKLGGDVVCESEEGVGSTFKFSLPHMCREV